MAAWNASNQQGGTAQSLSTTFKTILSVTAATSTLTAAKINEIRGGPNAVPNNTDCEIEWKCDAQTTVGTGTTVTPIQLGATGGRAAGSVCTANNTAEPTVTSNTQVWGDAFNQRQGFIWQCIPGQELMVPATNTNGLGVRAKSSTYTGATKCELVFVE